jgi:hypothetical protein
MINDFLNEKKKNFLHQKSGRNYFKANKIDWMEIELSSEF